VRCVENLAECRGPVEARFAVGKDLDNGAPTGGQGTHWAQTLSAPRLPVNRRHVLGFTRGRVVESLRVRIPKRLDRLFDDVPMESRFSQQPLGEWKRTNWWPLRIGGDASPLTGGDFPCKHPTRNIAPHEPKRSSVVIDPD
jgi:hypothetical protein